VAKNNRLLERHDAVHGAYWKTYDFEAVPQNLVERENLLPDRRNLFAHPLGPGATENFFQHAGGEVIYNLPNGLQGYLLVNANGVRVDKAPTALVSDPKRPDRAVEAGISCMACHYRGILPKTDQVRDYVQKNPKAFSKSDAELILALYVPGDKMKALMDEDAERFRKAVEKLGARVSAFEPVSTMTLRYEDDLDLPTAAAELSLKPDELRDKLGRSETLSRNLGALKVAGGVVQRQVFIQSFGDLVKQLRLGTLLKPTLSGQSLPDNTGELDPLEGQSSQANSMAFSPDGRRALFASADKSVRLWDVERERDLRRFIGHTASVWSVAFAPDGRQALSGGADHTVRLWDVETGRELHAFKGHEGLVTAVAFSPDGRQALSGGYDHAVLLWDLEKRREIRRFSDLARYVNHVAFSPDGRQALICGGKDLLLLDLEKGRAIRRLTGHADAVILAAFSADGRRLLSGSDDGTARLWDVETGHQLQVYQGHAGSVKSVAFAPDGRQILSAGADTTVRLWEVESGKELRRFEGHVESVLHVAFLPDRRHGLSGGRDSAVRIWDLAAAVPPLPPREVPPSGDQGPAASAARELRPTKAIPVKGIVSSLVLAPDGKWLYYLDASARKVLRLDVAAQVAANSVQLDDETEVLVLSPDGKRLYTLGSIPGRPLLANTPLDPDVKDSQVQVIDAAKMEVRAPLRLSGPSFDLAARDGGTVFVSLGNGQWTEILGLDVVKRSAPTSWGGVWRNSFLKLSPDQKRLYVSTQGVMPGQIDAFVIPEKLDDKPVQYTSPEKGKHPLGGEFLLSPDGKFLLCKTGTVLRLSAEREEDLKYAATVELFLAAAVDPERRATLLLTQDGSLKHYSYPDFKVRGTYRLGGLAYQAAYDGKQARLYVAVVDPKLLAERPRARGFGDIHVYDLKAVLREAGQ
jgi:WD40 repeat protein